MRKKMIVTVFLLAILFSQNLIALAKGKPFWQVSQDNPLMAAHTCAEVFNSFISAEPKIGFFYQQPQPGFVLSDKRITAQVQLQAALAPQIIDHQPDQLNNYRWVVGYFENEKVADNEAAAIAPLYQLQTRKVCQNYVLFERVNP